MRQLNNLQERQFLKFVYKSLIKRSQIRSKLKTWRSLLLSICLIILTYTVNQNQKTFI